MAMLRAAAPLTRKGRVVFSSLVRLCVAPAPPLPARIPPSRPSSCGFLLGSSVGVVRNMKTETEFSSSMPAGVLVVDKLKAIDERLSKLSIVAEEIQKTQEQLENAEGIIIKRRDELFKFESIAAKEMQKNKEQSVKNIEEWVLLILEVLETICFLVGIAYFGTKLTHYWTVGHKGNDETEPDNELKQKQEFATKK